MKITTAMILAAGRGSRMQRLTDNCPKPLLKVQGKELIRHVVGRITSYGIRKIVVNVCYQKELLQSTLTQTQEADFIFSEEESALETGGGVKKALPLLLPEGKNGFFVLNSDPLWAEPVAPLLDKMAHAWNPETMDVLLAIEPLRLAMGDELKGNYFIEQGALRRIRPEETEAPYFFIGVQILHPRIFENTPDTPFSSRELYDKAQAAGRLAYVMHDGRWFNINTPKALKVAQEQYHP